MAFITDVNISFKDGAQLDGFGRIRSVNPLTLFESKLLYDDQPMWWDEAQVSGSGTSGTYNTNQSSKTLAVSNLTAGRRVRQSKIRSPYQPGKGQVAKITGKLGAGGAGITKRMGLFDDNDGIYVERTGASTINVVLRSFVTGSAVNTAVAQASWNLDTLDGSANAGNPSKLTLDMTKSQLFIIDFAWLGVSRVRVGFVIGGKIYYVHEFNAANITTVVFMSNPNLPLRYEISNDGSGGVASMDCFCGTVMTEGGSDRPGMHMGVDNSASPITISVNANYYPLLAIRVASTMKGAFVEPHHVELMNTVNNAAFNYRVLLNPTITGTALSYSSITGSPVEYAIGTTATTVSGGTQMSGGFGFGGVAPVVAQDLTHTPLGFTIAGVSDVLVVAVNALVTNNQIIRAALHWIESI